LQTSESDAMGGAEQAVYKNVRRVTEIFPIPVMQPELWLLPVWWLLYLLPV